MKLARLKKKDAKMDKNIEERAAILRDVGATEIDQWRMSRMFNIYLMNQMNQGSIKQWIRPNRKRIVGRIKWITMKSEETTFSLNHLNMLIRSETIMATLWESIWKEVHVVVCVDHMTERQE